MEPAPTSGKTPSDATRRQFLGRVAAATATAATAAWPRPAAGSAKPLGLGFIGCGGRGRALMEVVHGLRRKGEAVEIVAVCDAYRPRRQKSAELYQAKPYAAHAELLADPRVDAVGIATPDHLHAPQAIDALGAGKDVYCEKPLTHWRQFGLAKRLAEEARRSGRVFQVGTQGMSDPAWRLIAKLVREGLIGRPIHAECGYFRVGDWGERGMPVDDPDARPGADLDWKAFLGDAPDRPFDVSRYFRWRMYEDYAGGPVTDLFPHALTPVVHMLGLGFPARAVATGGMFRYTEREVPDTFNMLIDYPEKVTVAVLGTQGNNMPGTGARGAGNRVPLLRGWEGTLTVRGSEVVFLPAEGSNQQPRQFPVEGTDDIAEFWRKFLACCRARDAGTDADAGLAYRVQTAVIMGMLSLRHGKTAVFDPEKQEIVI